MHDPTPVQNPHNMKAQLLSQCYPMQTVGNMDGSNDVRNPNAVRNPKPTYASVEAADQPQKRDGERQNEEGIILIA